jgi:8-oxo-dGTP diphosphatase
MTKSEQGAFTDRYNVIPRSLIFITQGDRVLLLKGAPTKRLWANRYNGIGGHVERGEDVLTAARRELEEEAGLEGAGLWLCGTIIIDASDHTGIAIFVFRCDTPVGQVVLTRPSDEGTLEWVRFSDLGYYPLVEDLKTLLPRVLKMQPGDVPFAARSFYDEADQQQLVFADTDAQSTDS